MTPEAASASMRKALALQEQGRHEQALSLYTRIVESYPRHPDALHNLGLACLHAGRTAAAETYLLRAIELRPHFDRARSNLVRIWTRLDRSQTLAEIVSDPSWLSALDFPASLSLAEYFRLRKEPARMLVAARRAVELDSSSAPARRLLGIGLLRSNRAEEAEGHLREALRLTPNDPALMIDMARCLFSMQAWSKERRHWLEGRSLVEAAVRLAPGRCRGQYELGLVLETDGELEQASVAFERALSLEVDHLPSLSSLAAIRRARAPRELMERLRSVLQSEGRFPVAERARGFQSLGRCHDGHREFDEAFACFERANRLLAGERTYDRAGRERYCDRLIESYSHLASQPDWPRAEGPERPLFIVGMPRSGTTLLEHLLASHPLIEAAGEVVYFTELERAQRSLHLPDGSLCENWRERMLPDHRRRVRTGLCDILDRVSRTSRYVIDKMPFNFWQLGMIAWACPGAKIIHCRRDPLDTGLSCFIEAFGASHDWAWRLPDIAHYYRQYERLMAGWGSLLGAHIHELDYEALVADPRASIQGILRFLQIEWCDELSSHGRQSRSIRTPSNWQVRQPLYRTSVGRWRHYARHLAPLIEGLR